MDRNSATSSATGTNSIKDELAFYVSAVKSHSGNNALEFWINAESSFPLLAPLAENLISAPGSQAYVERVFLVCGDLTSVKRSRLTKHLETRTFLKINCRYCGDFVRHDILTFIHLMFADVSLVNSGRW